MATKKTGEKSQISKHARSNATHEKSIETRYCNVPREELLEPVARVPLQSWGFFFLKKKWGVTVTDPLGLPPWDASVAKYNDSTG